MSPALVILDLNLPKKGGAEVLARLRRIPRCAGTSVLVFTSSNSARDRDEMASLGVRQYLRKPSDYTEYMKLGSVVKNLLEEQDTPTQ